MIVSFSIIPLGKGTGIGETVAGVIEIVEASGITYKLNPMGTVIEGDWEQVMETIHRCHQFVMQDTDRAITNITVDDRKGYTNAIESKVLSVKRRLGREPSTQDRTDTITGPVQLPGQCS